MIDNTIILELGYNKNNIVIYQCLADQLFVSAFCLGIGKY